MIFYFEIGFFYSSCEMTQGMPRHNNMADTEWSQSVFSPFYQFSTEKMAMAEQLFPFLKNVTVSFWITIQSTSV